MSENGNATNDSDRVWLDEMRSAFIGETIERDGVSAEIEAVITTDDDSRDNDARYSLEVRAHRIDNTSTESEQ